MKTFGVTVLAELYGISFQNLDNLHLIEELMRASCNEASMTFISIQSKKFEPQGVSCIIFLEESHISIHTWPEHKFACVDVFTCGEKASPILAVKFLANKLGANKYSMKIIKRENNESVNSF
jgi:S-adenosylmethionine decarboxylase